MRAPRVPLGKAMLIGSLVALVPLLLNVGAAFVTDRTGADSWLLAPVVAVGGAMVITLIQAYGSAGSDAPARAPARDQWPGQPPPRRGYSHPESRGTPLPVALLIAVVVLGLGGWAVTFGVRYVTGYITGNEPGVERLLAKASATSGGLELTVESVEHTRHFTRVGVLAENRGDSTTTLPLFGNATLGGRGQNPLEADAFKSHWSESIPPGSAQRGTITFSGRLPDALREAELAFATVFAQGFGGPNSITVRGIKLRPPP